ncbi:phosphate regulon sensor histidine kinase PhoR [Polycyclovorans algicola]|uniref:phosphate regulon sensor histidine kinase PhoR n=1 Tax=Polycyclovorans algicola TaxID=616992 RepID=UPI0004A6D75F|nr:phosphate regulon sensor histidine kinase PhoR [Polycyclovorans algicola]
MLAVWRQELVKLLLLCGLGALVGALFSGAIWGFLVVLFFLTALQYRYLAALLQWLRQPKQNELPDPGGVWGEVYDRLVDLQRRNKKKKKRLAAMLADFQASTAALPDGAVVLSPRGEIVRANHAAQTLLGLRAQDSGIRITLLVRHPRFVEMFEAGVQGREVEIPSPVNRGKQLNVRVINYGESQGLMIVRDVSELRRLEHARRDFVANASHELRTPLTVLKGYLEMMETESRDGELKPWATPLQEMYKQTNRMESLVGDMLKLARLESDIAARHDWIRASTLLRQALAEAQSVADPQHQFVTEMDDRIEIFGGETELTSLFTNLVGNAVRYTPPPGVITVKLFAMAGGRAGYSVQDSGIGIAEDDIPRLTERFYRVDVGRSRASGGTGLGLSIVKHAVERHDAQLKIESKVGEGSCFTCEFPVHRVRLAQSTLDLTQPGQAVG